MARCVLSKMLMVEKSGWFDLNALGSRRRRVHSHTSTWERRGRMHNHKSKWWIEIAVTFISISCWTMSNYFQWKIVLESWNCRNWSFERARARKNNTRKRKLTRTLTIHDERCEIGGTFDSNEWMQFFSSLSRFVFCFVLFKALWMMMMVMAARKL